MGKRLVRIALATLAIIVIDWAPGTPPFDAGWGQAKAQAPIPPPSAWHPYRGGTNCVQVADANGNFSCSPLVTINPATGSFSALGGTGAFSPVYGALVVAPSGNTLQALGNDIVIAKAPTGTAPAGPGLGGVTFRVRPSPRIPGYCTVVAIAGGSFGVEYPVAFLNPNYPFSGPSTPANLFDYFTLDLPGGPAGC